MVVAAGRLTYSFCLSAPEGVFNCLSLSYNKPNMPRKKKSENTEAVETKKTKTSAKKSSVSFGRYDYNAIEKKWQKYWEEKKLFETPDLPEGEKVYILDMFPYPSADGLHVGHPEGYTATDIMARHLRMKGKSVLHPMGWDAFGLPAENYAIKTGTHPATVTQKNIDNFRKQIKSLGLSYDWSREVSTTDPNYYKWTQWIFLQLFKKGLAYETDAPINWCPKDKTCLANEEVVDGKCERCGTPVERKKMRQWILKITAYADRLLSDLEKVDWPEPIKKLQRDWIGKKMGAKVFFEVRGMKADIEIFPTRVYTIFGATFIVLAPEHKLIREIVTPAQSEQVMAYIDHAAGKADLEREVEAAADKSGVFTGAYAVNPINQQEIPIWVADYVLGNVGAGAIMAVPAHDARDYDFAKKYDLAIHAVVVAEGSDANIDLPYTGEGVLVDSGGFSGMHSDEAKKNILNYLERRGEGEKAETLKLRDWIFSRQRYWGEPIPIVHCPSCGIVPVREIDLPVLLPEVEKYEPTGTGESPLAAIEDWVNTRCPKCSGEAKRETNTMPQWAGSCWYYLRFIDPHNSKEAWDKEKEKVWMPVDLYVGGAEHAVLHLLYARFWHKVLFDAGFVSTDEPFKSLRNQGLILAPDGQKMSKSRGNVINPDDIIKEFGADTLRVYEMFMGPFEDAKPWNTRSMVGISRFLKRVWDISEAVLDAEPAKKSPKELEARLQILVNKVTSDIENMKFNTAIAAMMEFSHSLLASPGEVSRKVISTYVLILSPFAPHIAEEIWERLGNKRSVQKSSWPDIREVEAGQKVRLAVQVNGKLRDALEVPVDMEKEEVAAMALKSEKIKTYIQNISQVEKMIYVPGRILNFVVKKVV